MTTLDKIELSTAAARTRLIESTAAVQSRQEFATGGKNVPVTQPNGVQQEQRRKELDQALKNVTGYVQNITRQLNFTIDEELDEPIVTVLDQDSGEVIRQIPTEDMLELAKTISEMQDKTAKQGLKGVLFRGDA